MNGIPEQLTLGAAQSANPSIGTGKKFQRGKNLEGIRFGQMDVLKEKSKGFYSVECSICGNKEIRMRDNIVRAIKRGVGICNVCGDYKKHKMSSHPAYKVWEGMITRCYSEKHMAYKNYGGRGILVCEKWKESPKDFIIWLEKNGWNRGLQIDRINNDLGYYPENCRIVTGKQNRNNTRVNVHVFLNGETLTVSQAARIVKINESTIRERIRHGWTNDKLFIMPRVYKNKNG